jgi:hypothetical protein
MSATAEVREAKLSLKTPLPRTASGMAQRGYCDPLVSVADEFGGNRHEFS